MIRVIFLMSCAILLFIVATIQSTSNVTTLSFKLIHPDSLSPSHVSTLAYEDDITGVLMGTTLTFLVNISFGVPPVPQLLIMDTGSALTWTRCRPCNSINTGIYPIFEPLESSSYSNLSCDSKFCGDHTSCTTNPNSVCPFSASYRDGARSLGYTATEQLTFVTSDDGMYTVSDFVFGCSHEVYEDTEVPYNGLFGLGDHDFSLIRQLGSKFSYCFGDIYDLSYSYNQLKIGNGSVIQGTSTSIDVADFYYVTLEGISLGNIQIAPDIFESQIGEIQVCIDTGTTLNYLTRILYEPLIDTIEIWMNGTFQRFNDVNNPDDLCYYGAMYEGLEWFPNLIFHFAEGADFELPVTNMFRQSYYNAFCLATVPVAPGVDEMIIGAIAQQYYNFGYDLTTKRVYFENTDCQLLAE